MRRLAGYFGVVLTQALRLSMRHMLKGRPSPIWPSTIFNFG